MRTKLLNVLIKSSLIVGLLIAIILLLAELFLVPYYLAKLSYLVSSIYVIMLDLPFLGWVKNCLLNEESND